MPRVYARASHPKYCVQFTITFSESLLRLVVPKTVPQLQCSDPAGHAATESRKRSRTVSDRKQRKQQQLEILNSGMFMAQLQEGNAEALFELNSATRSSKQLHLVRLRAPRDSSRQAAWSRVFVDARCNDWWDIFQPAGNEDLQFIMYDSFLTIRTCCLALLPFFLHHQPGD